MDVQTVKTTPKEPKKKIPEMVTWRVPDCCKEGRDDCTHVVKRQEIRKVKNVGL